MGAQDLKARARKLVQSGCDDPVVLYFAARAHVLVDEDTREATELFERAVAGMHDVAYPRAVARFAAAGLRADYDRGSGSDGKTNALSPLELGWFLESLKDGSYLDGEDVVLTVHLTSGKGESFFERNRQTIVTALQAAPWVDPWVRELHSGMRHVDDAWDARSSDYGHKVKPEGWKGFAESLAAARQSLTESWRLRPDRPEAASEMIAVAMGGASEEPARLWFDRAVQARFDHLPAYRLLINALRTRWGGDADALLAFARECAETRRFDTEVPFMAFRAVEQMEWDRINEARGEDDEPVDPHRPRPRSVYRDEAVYGVVSTVLERYVREPGSKYRWQRWASLHAAVAYKAGRYADARKALVDVGGTLDREAVESRRRAAARGPDRGLCVPRGRFTRARRVPLSGAPGRSGAPPVSQGAGGRSCGGALLSRPAHRGDRPGRGPARGPHGRVPSPGGPGRLDGEAGTWTVQADGALVGTTGAKGTLILADGRVGPDFEIEADIEVVSTSNGQFQVGIAFGLAPAFWTTDWSSFRIKRTAHEGDVVYFSRHFYAPVRPVQRPVALRSRVVLQSWNGSLWAYVDGEPVVTAYVPEWKLSRTADRQVGFGAYYDDNIVTARYRDVSLRRLTSAPAPPERNRPAPGRVNSGGPGLPASLSSACGRSTRRRTSACCSRGARDGLRPRACRARAPSPARGRPPRRSTSR